MKRLMFCLSSVLLFADYGTYAQSVVDSYSPDGQRIIMAHTHTQQQNISHENFCTSIGGVDITDDMDIKLSTNATDAIYCKITDRNKFLNTMQYAMVGTTNEDGEPQLSNEKAPDVVKQLSKIELGGTYWAQAADGSVRMYIPWYCSGVGHFTNVNAQSSIVEAVPDFGCSASNSDYMGTGTLTATVTCKASQGVPWTYNYATACVNNANCVQDRGIINFTN